MNVLRNQLNFLIKNNKIQFSENIDLIKTKLNTKYKYKQIKKELEYLFYEYKYEQSLIKYNNTFYDARYERIHEFFV